MPFLPDGYLRLLDMFGPAVNQLAPQTGTPTAQPNAPNPPIDYGTANTGDEDIFDSLMKMYQPKSDISNQYRDLLANVPQRNDPGKLGKIFGVMAAMGAGVHPAGIAMGQPVGFVGGRPGEAQDAYERTAYAPYYRDLEDWQTKSKALGAGATEEEKANANQRGMLIGAARSAISQQRANAYSDDILSKTTDRAARTEILRQRSAAYVFHQLHPDYVFQETSDGYVLATNKKDPTDTTYLTDPETGDKIKAAKLPDQQKMIMGFQQGIAKIHAQGEETRKTEGVKEGFRQLDIAARGSQQRTTNADKSVAPKNETPTQARARLFNKLREAYNTHPEWQPYIDVKAGTIIPAPDERINKSIHDFIYGTDINLPKDKVETEKPRVKVADLNGNILGTIEDSPEEINKLDKSKYKVVR